MLAAPQGLPPAETDMMRKFCIGLATLVVGIAHACIPDPDAMLRDLLVGGIGDCAHGRPPDRPRHPQAGTDRIAVPATQPMGPPA